MREAHTLTPEFPPLHTDCVLFRLCVCHTHGTRLCSGRHIPRNTRVHALCAQITKQQYRHLLHTSAVVTRASGITSLNSPIVARFALGYSWPSLVVLPWTAWLWHMPPPTTHAAGNEAWQAN